MSRISSCVVVLAAAVSLGACATVTRGANTAWQVNTLPQGATVRTSNGRVCDSTPCALEMPRRSTFTASITRPGYKPVQLAVTNHVTAIGALAFVGNGVIGGIPGAAIDLFTGATLDLTPNGDAITLERDDSLTAQMYGYRAADYPAQTEGLAPGETLSVSRF